MPPTAGPPLPPAGSAGGSGTGTRRAGLVLVVALAALCTAPVVDAINRLLDEHDVRELADAWRGFEGAKSFASLEGQLVIDARHATSAPCWAAPSCASRHHQSGDCSPPSTSAPAPTLESIADDLERFTP